MATNSGDLAQSLIEGGLTPQAARIIANAIANASSPTLSKGGDQTDATPVEDLRLITADTRRYRLTNLDYSPNEPFQERLSSNPGAYQDPTQDHPYKDSQPIVSAPPLSSPRVQGGNYVGVENVVDSGSAVSKVDLKLRTEQGRHLRLDPSTKSLEAVNFLASTESPKVMAAEWKDAESGTELVVSLRNLEELNLLLANADSRKALVFPQDAAVGPASLAAGTNRSLAKVNVLLSDGTKQDLLVWTDGAAVSVPAVPTCRAYGRFAGITSNGAVTPAEEYGISSVERVAAGNYKITMDSGVVTGANYCILANAGTPTDNNTNRIASVRMDGQSSTAVPTSTVFYLRISNTNDTGVDNSTVWFAVFQ